jgi:hypothetical protein
VYAEAGHAHGFGIKEPYGCSFGLKNICDLFRSNLKDLLFFKSGINLNNAEVTDGL